MFTLNVIQIKIITSVGISGCKCQAGMVSHKSYHLIETQYHTGGYIMIIAWHQFTSSGDHYVKSPYHIWDIILSNHHHVINSSWVWIIISDQVIKQQQSKDTMSEQSYITSWIHDSHRSLYKALQFIA